MGSEKKEGVQPEYVVYNDGLYAASFKTELDALAHLEYLKDHSILSGFEMSRSDQMPPFKDMQPVYYDSTIGDYVPITSSRGERKLEGVI